VHSMNETKEAFRLVVIRRPYQGNLFDEEESTEKYTTIATNRGGSAEEVVQWYNQRGESSETSVNRPERCCSRRIGQWFRRNSSTHSSWKPQRTR